MLIEAATMGGFLAFLFLLDLGFSEVWVDNQLNTDSWFGGDVAGIGPRQ